MIDEGDILFIQCKMGLKGLKSTRKGDGLSVIFIDTCASALTPRLNSIETVLQVPENITLLAVCLT
jgi:hypothetical protein